jgi:outer membrane protein
MRKTLEFCTRRSAPVYLLLVLNLLFGSSFLTAQEQMVRSFSLSEVQDYAVQHSYDSRKSRLDVLTANAQVKETTSAGLPQISSGISYMNNLELTTMLIPNFFEGKFDEKIAVQFGTQHNTSLNFTVNQLVFSGSYFVGLRTSKIYRQLADNNLKRTQLDVLETVTNTYYLILVTEKSQSILESNIVNLEKTFFEIKEMYKEGFVAETDVDLLQITLTKLKNGLQTVKRQKEVAYKLLNFQMGLELEEPISLTENLEDFLSNPPSSGLSIPEFSLARNVDYQLLKTQEQLSRKALKNEKMQYWPTITAFYTFQLSAMRNEFNLFAKERWYRAQMLGVNVNIPIFRSGAQSARVKKAALALQKAESTRIQVGEGLLLEASRAKAALDSARENYQNTKDNMALSQKVYDRTLIKYKEGLVSSLDLTQANNQFLQVQSEYVQAMSELLSAKNKIDRLNSSYPGFNTFNSDIDNDLKEEN